MNRSFYFLPMDTTIASEQNYEIFSNGTMPVPVLEDSDIESNISSEEAGSCSELSNPLTPPLLKGATDGVKQELRNAIRCRRVAKGLDEMPNLDAKRPRLDELSTTEQERRRLRRERNKLAAFKCRQRRKEHIQFLENESDGIDTENNKLELEIATLKEQRNQLEEMLKAHSCLITGSKSDSCASEAAKSSVGSVSPTTPNGSCHSVKA